MTVNAAVRAGDWKQIKLGDLCTIVAPQVDPRLPEYAELPLISGENIKSGNCRLMEVRTARQERVISGKYLFEAGDILYSKLRPYLRKVIVAPFRGLCSADMYPLRPDTVAVEPAFLALMLLTDEFTRYAVAESGRARMPKLNREQLFAWRCWLPPREEQRRIVSSIESAMSELRRAGAAAEAQFEASKSLEAAYVRAVFSGPGTSRWPRRPLREACEADGQYGSSARAHVEGVGVPILGMGNIVDGRIRWEGVRYVLLPDDETAKYLLRPGDLLFNRTNSADLVGKSAIFSGDRQAIFASYLIRFKPRKDVVPDFLCAYINSDEGRLFIRRNMARAIGQVNISASVMHRMLVPIPPMGEQARVVEVLKRQREGAQKLEQAVGVTLDIVAGLAPASLRWAFSGGL